MNIPGLPGLVLFLLYGTVYFLPMDYCSVATDTIIHSWQNGLL